MRREIKRKKKRDWEEGLKGFEYMNHKIWGLKEFKKCSLHVRFKVINFGTKKIVWDRMT